MQNNKLHTFRIFWGPECTQGHQRGSRGDTARGEGKAATGRTKVTFPKIVSSLYQKIPPVLQEQIRILANHWNLQGFSAHRAWTIWTEKGGFGAYCNNSRFQNHGIAKKGGRVWPKPWLFGGFDNMWISSKSDNSLKNMVVCAFYWVTFTLSNTFCHKSVKIGRMEFANDKMYCVVVRRRTFNKLRLWSILAMQHSQCQNFKSYCNTS